MCLLQDGKQMWSYKQLWTPIESLLVDRHSEVLLGQTQDGMLLCWDIQGGKMAFNIPARLPEMYTLVTAAHHCVAKKILAAVVVNGSVQGRSTKVR